MDQPKIKRSKHFRVAGVYAAATRTQPGKPLGLGQSWLLSGPPAQLPGGISVCERFTQPAQTLLWSGFGEKGIQHWRQFLEPPICHARIADGIGMRAIIGHRGRIKSAVMIDERKGRFRPVL